MKVKRIKVPKGVAGAIRKLVELRVKRKAIQAEEAPLKILVKEFMVSKGVEYLPVDGAHATIDIQFRTKWDMNTLAKECGLDLEVLGDNFSTVTKVNALTCVEDD